MRLACLVCALAFGCGDDDGARLDAAADSDLCGGCDDGLFCNGSERCVDGVCAAGAPPCTAAGCDELEDLCTGECLDADGDGATDIACGGTDCDDADPGRFPGNTEVCDPERRDEDCDPATVGPDEDGDGFASNDCCNGRSCGADCDDTNAGIGPSSADGCGGGDEDCDGTIDEEPDATFYRDLDDDTYGDDDDTVMSCSLPPGYSARAGDCDDDIFTNPLANEVNPGETEVCNGVDDDCDGVIDETLDGEPCPCPEVGRIEPCDFDPSRDGVGVCRLGTRECLVSGWSSCAGATSPSSESCNGADDDCDGSTDEGLLVDQYLDADADGFGAGVVVRACTLLPGHSFAAGDCDDLNPDVSPDADELCNGVDDDCDGVEDDLDPDASTVGCPPGNGAGTCNGTACSYTCSVGFYDCTVEAGCETPDGVAACGSCGEVCRTNSTCGARRCECSLGFCNPGTWQADCTHRIRDIGSRSRCESCRTGPGAGAQCVWNGMLGVCICT